MICHNYLNFVARRGIEPLLPRVEVIFNIINIQLVNFKNFIKKLKTNRKEYMQELKEIKSVLNSIKFNINKNYLNTNLIVEGSDK